MLIPMTATFPSASMNLARAAEYTGALALQGVSGILPDGRARAAVRRAFARNLVSMRGVPMKLSQALSMSGSAEEGRLHREALAALPPLSGSEMLMHLEAVAPGLLESIATFGAEGIAASLGQVHHALMKDGRDCAVKIRYPGISSEVGLDVKTMNLLLGMFGGLGEGFPIGAYRELFAAELAGELDYRAEARKQAMLRDGCADLGGIVIPRPYPEESGDGHILMDWESSLSPVRFAAGAGAALKRQALDHLCAFTLRTLFGIGAVHADPNPGNFGFRPSPAGLKAVVYDFGSVVELPAAMPVLLLDLLEAVLQGTDPYPFLLALGFAAEPLEPIRTRLRAFCDLIFAPFLSGHPLAPKDWNRKERAALILGAQRWNFMIAAPVAIFPLMRAMHGLVYYATLFDAPLHMRPAVGALLAAKRPAAAASAPAPQADDPGFPGAARSLRVEVRRNGIATVSLTFPRNAVERLPDLLDAKTLGRIRARGIRLEGIAEDARRGGFRPMDLFTCEYDGKSIKVWLE